MGDATCNIKFRVRLSVPDTRKRTTDLRSVIAQPAGSFCALALTGGGLMPSLSAIGI